MLRWRNITSFCVIIGNFIITNNERINWKNAVLEEQIYLSAYITRVITVKIFIRCLLQYILSCNIMQRLKVGVGYNI